MTAKLVIIFEINIESYSALKAIEVKLYHRGLLIEKNKSKQMITSNLIKAMSFAIAWKSNCGWTYTVLIFLFKLHDSFKIMSWSPKSTDKPKVLLDLKNLIAKINMVIVLKLKLNVIYWKQCAALKTHWRWISTPLIVKDINV